MATATKAPSGLAIARDNMRFTFSWKIADSNYGGGQKLQWQVYTGGQRLNGKIQNGKWSAWTDVNIGVKTTSISVTQNASSYWPYTSKFLYGIRFRVRGKRSESGKAYNWSGWTAKVMDLTAPDTPSLTATLDDNYSNVCAFAWSTPNVNNSNLKPFANVEWQTRLIKENNETDGSKIAWNSNCSGWAAGTGAASGSNTRTEDTSLLAVNAYTRWFRVRARGCGGNGSISGCSAWRYAKHVYSTPLRPVIGSSSYTVISGGSMVVSVDWTAATNASHPIDETTVQWAIATPDADQACPAGASWTDAGVSRDTGGKDAAKFAISSVPEVDECLFVRIAVRHDSNITYSVPRLVKRGTVAAPENVSATTDDTTFRATITATNTSDIADSRLAVVFRSSGTGDKDFVIGIIPHGETSVTVQCPDWTDRTPISFGVYAFQGSASSSVRADGVNQYAVTANMKSDTTWRGGNVPVEPGNVNAVISGDSTGEVILTWTWDWTEANRAEISWSMNPNAWESTDEPSTYLLESTHAAKWRVSGLDTGVKWYFCVRLAYETDDGINYGPYCDPVEVDLSSAPDIPVLILSAPVVTESGSVTATWGYITTDGTQQAYAEICEADVTGDTVTYGTIIAHATTQQHVSINVAENWTVGETYYLCVRVTSASGHKSEWSDPVSVTVAEPIACSITQTSLVTLSVVDDEENARSVTALTAMPLTVTIEGAGEGGVTSLIVERSAEYHMDRPDGSVSDGYEGETVAIVRQFGEAQISVGMDDLIGLFDDGAQYRLIATVEDGLGQSDSEEIEFEVHWTHQAETPEAVAVIEDSVAKITAAAPEGAAEGDVCDIYRLSADRPELIVEGGAFGVTYVDPYPAIGPSGGHRIVHRTVNGDYITADNQPAWTDLQEGEGDCLNADYAIIDFNGEQLEVRYNTDFDNDFRKDFKETQYLGGSVRGDWNPGVSRSTTVSAAIESSDTETLERIRRLAAWTGICHVRTQDGSSYAADVQVKDSLTYETAGKILLYTFTITRVDPEGFDGMTLEQWEEITA